MRDRCIVRLSTIAEFNWPDVVWLLCWAKLRCVQLTITAIRYSWTMNVDCMYTVHQQSLATSTRLVRWMSVYSRYTLAGTTLLTEIHTTTSVSYTCSFCFCWIENRTPMRRWTAATMWTLTADAVKWRDDSDSCVLYRCWCQWQLQNVWPRPVDESWLWNVWPTIMYN